MPDCARCSTPWPSERTASRVVAVVRRRTATRRTGPGTTRGFRSGQGGDVGTTAPSSSGGGGAPARRSRIRTAEPAEARAGPKTAIACLAALGGRGRHRRVGTHRHGTRSTPCASYAFCGRSAQDFRVRQAPVTPTIRFRTTTAVAVPVVSPFIAVGTRLPAVSRREIPGRARSSVAARGARYRRWQGDVRLPDGLEKRPVQRHGVDGVGTGAVGGEFEHRRPALAEPAPRARPTPAGRPVQVAAVLPRCSGRSLPACARRARRRTHTTRQEAATGRGVGRIERRNNVRQRRPRFGGAGLAARCYTQRAGWRSILVRLASPKAVVKRRRGQIDEVPGGSLERPAPGAAGG